MLRRADTRQMCIGAGIRAYLREEATPSKIIGYEHWNYLNEHVYQFSAWTGKTEARYRRKTWKASAQTDRF